MFDKLSVQKITSNDLLECRNFKWETFVNNYKIEMFKFSLIFVILLFLLFPISFADTEIQRNPQTIISNDDIVNFSITTDTPAKIEVICNGTSFSDNYLLSTSHTITTRKFSANSDVNCEVKVMNNASEIIRTHTSSDKPLLNFHVYSKQPVLTITDNTIEGSFTAEFNKPKGSQKTYAFEKSFTIKNDGLLPMQTVKITKSGDLSNWTTVSQTEISSISALGESDKITVKIEIPETAQEKTYQGYIKITSGNAGEKTISFSVRVIYPVEVEITSIKSDIKDMLKAGNSYESKLNIKETMGYKGTGKISVRSSGFPNWMNVEGINDISNINARGETNLTIKVNVPERNVIPGKYYGGVTLSNDYIKDRDSSSYKFNFEIPFPKMSVDKTIFIYTIDPGNKAGEKFKISETDGYTPIEGLVISLTNCKRTTKQGREESFDGLKNWIQFNGIDSYIKQGNSNDVSVSINTNKEYGTGEYTCDCKVTTTYAGEKNLNIKFILADVSITETLNKLKDLESSATNNYEKNIISATKTLIEKIRTDIYSNDFISSYTISFLTSTQKIKSKTNVNDYNEAYKEVENMISQKNSISGLKNKYGKYKTEITDIEKNVDVYFKEIVGNLLNHFKNEGDRTKDSNMLFSVEQYNKVLDLCGKISCENKGEISNTISELNNKIISYNISIGQNKAKINTLKDEISKLLFIDPFGKNEKYDDVINCYADMMDKREKIGGDNKDAEVSFFKTEKSKIEEEKTREVTMSAAGLLITMLVILSLLYAFIFGHKAYNKDKKNVELVKFLFSK